MNNTLIIGVIIIVVFIIIGYIVYQKYNKGQTYKLDYNAIGVDTSGLTFVDPGQTKALTNVFNPLSVFGKK